MFETSNVNTLVSWFTAVLVFLYSSSFLMSRKWRAYYHEIIHSFDERTGNRLIWGAPHARTYGIMWALIAGSLIASMTLWTINYSACNNTFYISVVALTLFSLVMKAMWAPMFIKMKSPSGALSVLTFSTAAAITALVLMALTVSYDSAGCIADKAGGIVACVLYGWPILWYALAWLITLQWTRLPRSLSFGAWMRNRRSSSPPPVPPRDEDEYGSDRYYAMRDEVGSPNNPNFSALRKSVLKTK